MVEVVGDVVVTEVEEDAKEVMKDEVARKVLEDEVAKEVLEDEVDVLLYKLRKHVSRLNTAQKLWEARC